MADTGEHRLFGIEAWRWELLSNFLTAFGVFGVLFGVYQYTAAVEADRASETLAMIERWTEDDYRSDFLALQQRTLSQIEGRSPADIQAAQSSPRHAELLSLEIGQAVMKDPDAAQHLDRVVYYFNLLGLCVEAKLCSADTADIFFGDTLRNFSAFFRDEVGARNKALPGYSQGFDLLVERFK